MALADATPEELARDVRSPRRRPRPAARPRARHAPRAVRRGRRGRPAALAGHAAAVGLRAAHPQAGRSASPRRRAAARPPPVDRDLVRSQRADGDRHRSRRPRSTPRIGRSRRCVAPELPTWNKTDPRPLDRSAPLEQADGTRPVDRPLRRAAAPAAARRHRQPPLLRLVLGRRARRSRLSAAVPRLARFVTEFGAQAVPADASFCEPERWPDLDWERLGRDARAPEADVRPLRAAGGLRARSTSGGTATQRYQARGLSTTSRRCAGSSTGPPVASPSSASPTAMPAVTWAVLDHERQPKLGYDALAQACQPVIVVADRLACVRVVRAKPSHSTSTSCPTAVTARPAAS